MKKESMIEVARQIKREAYYTALRESHAQLLAAAKAFISAQNSTKERRTRLLSAANQTQSAIDAVKSFAI